ncbi:MAG: hypothetical protein OEU91_05655 [Gammaproteobacteria bacterium]|nr:hypothetical protein [Gammaproteobacteria bacterium]
MEKIITSITFLIFVVVSSSSALAVPAALPQSIAPGLGALNWEVTNTGGTSSGNAFSGVCDQTSGLTIQDATSADGSTDAYDNAHSIWVDGAIFDAPGSVDLTGNTILAGPVVMSGLNVSVEYAFSDVVQAGRVRVIFQNPTPVTINASVDMAVNSGASTFTIEATSSLDAVFGTDDYWVVTSDGGPNDPVNTSVLWGQLADVPPSSVATTVFGCGGDKGIAATFDISVPTNARRQLLFFTGVGDIVGLGNTVAGATVNAAMFNSYLDIDPSLMAGIPDAELLEVVNWFLRPVNAGGGGGCSLDHKTTSAWKAGDLWLLLALISSLGLWRVRRKIDQ